MNLALELPAEVGGLFEAEFGGDLFDEAARKEELFGSLDALFVQPTLRWKAKLTVELALKLAAGKAAEAGETLGLIPRFLRKRFASSLR